MTSKAHEQYVRMRTRMEEVTADGRPPLVALGVVLSMADELAAARVTGSHSLLAQAASRLAALIRAADVPAALAPAAAGSSRLDLTAMLFQELVLRDVVDGRHQTAQRLREALRDAGHPTAWLPAELHSWERPVVVPRPGRGTSSWNGPRPPAPSYASGPIDASGFDFAEMTSAGERSRIQAAVTRWCTESNGRSEVRVFRSSVALASNGNWLRAASASCEFAAGELPAEVEVGTAEPGQILRLLFEAAASGGAYSGGFSGAFGRLHAWQSLGGLAGAGEDDTFEGVVAAASGCDWSDFRPWSSWFNWINWDLGPLNNPRGRLRRHEGGHGY